MVGAILRDGTACVLQQGTEFGPSFAFLSKGTRTWFFECFRVTFTGCLDKEKIRRIKNMTQGAIYSIR